MRFTKLVQAFACALAVSVPAAAIERAPVSPDHHEFEAALVAPFLGQRGEAREFALQFAFPDATDPSIVGWKLELVAPNGKPVRTWYGEERLLAAPIEVRVPWDGGMRD